MGRALASGDFVVKKGSLHSGVCRMSDKECSLSNTNRDIVPRAVIQTSLRQGER